MSVLFVCLGNICRSPTAEAVFRKACPRITCDSAGTSDWHVGDPPYGPMQDAARARGLEMSKLRARQFVRQDFDRFDLLIAMDPDNQRSMERLRPDGNETPIRRLGSFCATPQDVVPDPYYTRNFNETMDMIEDATGGLIAFLQR